MALYTVTTGNIAQAQDVNQIVNLLNGTTNDTPLVITNRIRAQSTGASATSGYVGGTTHGAPVSGTFSAGDFIIDQTGFLWICTAAGTPGTWLKAGTSLDTNAADIQPLGPSAVAGSIGKAADAGHVHPANTNFAYLNQANTFTLLQTMNQGLVVKNGLTLSTGDLSVSSGNIFVNGFLQAGGGVNAAYFTSPSYHNTNSVVPLVFGVGGAVINIGGTAFTPADGDVWIAG